MKLVRERQISYDFTHMRTLRDKTDEHKGRETKIIEKRGGGQNRRDINMENKQGCWRNCGRGDVLNESGALKNLLLKSLSLTWM